MHTYHPSRCSPARDFLEYPAGAGYSLPDGLLTGPAPAALVHRLHLLARRPAAAPTVFAVTGDCWGS